MSSDRGDKMDEAPLFTVPGVFLPLCFVIIPTWNPSYVCESRR